MLLSPEQADERLNSSKNLARRFGKDSSAQNLNLNSPDSSHPNPKVITIEQKGRNASIPNLPPDIRNEIAFRARAGENQSALASEFGTTQARVSQLERGRDKSLNEDAIAERLDAAKDMAVDRLLESLNLITPDKLKKESVRSLAGISSEMSRVVERISPKNPANEVNVQVVVYAPELKKESNFKQIEA